MANYHPIIQEATVPGPRQFAQVEFTDLQPMWPLCIPYVGCLCCPCIVTCNQSLVLESEEAVLTSSNLCWSSVERRPYAQIGEVIEMKMCMCCHAVKSNLNESGKTAVPICPGWGCEADKVRRLKDALQERKVGRGNIAQIQQAELTVAYVKDINAKLDAVMHHLNLATPPLANNAEVMEREIGDFRIYEQDTAIVTGRQVTGPGAPVKS